MPTYPGIVVFFGAGHAYLPWLITDALAEDFPKSTVKGRICLQLRLDWDKDQLKETYIDIYIKPRLMVLAVTLTSSLFLFYHFVFKSHRFIRGFCVAQSSFASIGGRRRRNILTFAELTFFYTFVILIILFDSILIFSFYHIQDLLGKQNVFIIHITSSAIQDFIVLVIFPLKVLFKSIESFPEIWTNFVPRQLDFYYSKYEIKPEMKKSDYDKTAEVHGRTDDDMTGIFKFITSLKLTR